MWTYLVQHTVKYYQFLCYTISNLDEMYRCTANFINNCISTSVKLVIMSHVSVFFSFMISLIDRNAFYCCHYDDRSLAISDDITSLAYKIVDTKLSENL